MKTFGDPEASQNAPIEVAALAYALVSSDPDGRAGSPEARLLSRSLSSSKPRREVNEADRWPAVKVVKSPKAAAVPVRQPKLLISLDLPTPAHSEVAAFETKETPESDTSMSQGSLLHRLDYSQVLPLTAD